MRNYDDNDGEKYHESHLRAFGGQIRRNARIMWWKWGWGNFGNARILGTFGLPTPP